MLGPLLALLELSEPLLELLELLLALRELLALLEPMPTLLELLEPLPALLALLPALLELLEPLPPLWELLELLEPLLALLALLEPLLLRPRPPPPLLHLLHLPSSSRAPSSCSTASLLCSSPRMASSPASNVIVPSLEVTWASFCLSSSSLPSAHPPLMPSQMLVLAMSPPGSAAP